MPPIRKAPRLDESIRTLRRCEGVLREQGIVRAGIAGSVARGDAGPGSDVDVLVEFAREPRLLDLGAIHFILEEAFGEPVDVLEPADLVRLAGERTLAEIRHAFD